MAPALRVGSGLHPARGALRKLRVLVADDNRDTVLTLMLLLREEGHEVRGVYTGTDALKAARFLSYDVIILDLDIPELSGYAIAQELRKTYYAARAPLLVALSGKWSKPSEKLLARAVGFDHHVAKPCDPNALLHLLAQFAAPSADQGVSPGPP